MIVRQIESPGLAHYSYFIADRGEALIIDPRRDIGVYLELARRSEATIRYVLETHRHEDFVSGSMALAQMTGTMILHSGKGGLAYGTPVYDDYTLQLGELRLRALETPGHTDDSLSFAMADTRTGDSPIAVFTGDALFVGSVGRTDLLGEEQQERMSRALYRSLHEKILPLGDGVLLYPAHGAGSACGASIVKRSFSSLGYERLHNPALQCRSEDEFAQRQRAQRQIFPPYFEHVRRRNIQGDAPAVLQVPAVEPLDPRGFEQAMREGAAALDLRPAPAFAGEHIPGSISLWQEGLSAYVGWIVEPEAELILIPPESDKLEGIVRQLLRMGYDNIRGYLRGGFASWQNAGYPTSALRVIDALGMQKELERGAEVLDVRKPMEWETEPFEPARRIFVGELERRLDAVPGGQVYTMCSTGNRGSLAASLLRKNGFTDVVNVLGGVKALQRLRERQHRGVPRWSVSGPASGHVPQYSGAHERHE